MSDFKSLQVSEPNTDFVSWSGVFIDLNNWRESEYDCKMYCSNIVAALMGHCNRIKVRGEEGKFFIFEDPNANNCDGVQFIVKLPDEPSKWKNIAAEILLNYFEEE